MIFEPGDRVKLAELPVDELERILRRLYLDLTCPGIIQPGEEAVIRSCRIYDDGSGGSCTLVGGNSYRYHYPIEALQHACRNWQLHRELRRAAATTEVASTRVDRSAYLTGMTESLEVR